MGLEQLGDQIRRLRLKARKTQEQVADEAGVSRMAVVRLENGSGSSLSTLMAVCRAIGAPLLPADSEQEGRRIRRLPQATRSSNRPERLRSFELHKEVVRALRTDPEAVIRKAKSNMPKVRANSSGPSATRWADEWEEALSGGVDDIVRLCLLDSSHGDDLRQVSPFAGVLTQQERLDALERARHAQA